jgi:hypothetical protein
MRELWIFKLTHYRQRWLFLVRYQPGKRPYRFGYRTMGDATPKIMTSKDAGWHWPWQDRSIAGRG